MRFLTTRNPVEVMVMQAVANKHLELEQKLSRSRAVDIANAYTESQKGG